MNCGLTFKRNGPKTSMMRREPLRRPCLGCRVRDGMRCIGAQRLDRTPGDLLARADAMERCVADEKQENSLVVMPGS